MQEVVIVFNVLLNPSTPTKLVTDSGASAKPRLLLEKEAFLLDLNREDGTISRDFNWIINSNEGAKLRVKVQQKDFLSFKLKCCLAPRHGDIRDRYVIIDATTDFEV